MEKADILEMTVAYLRATHCRRHVDVELTSGDVDRYAAGFRECAVHVGKYMLDAGVNFSAIHERLMSHLDKTLQTVVSADGSDRLMQGSGFESTSIVSTEQMLWTSDCDNTSHCSADTDDDYRRVCGTATEVDDDVIRWQYAKCGTRVTASVLTDTVTTTLTTYRETLHPNGEVDSPRSADEFPSFLPTTSTSEHSTSLASDVVFNTDSEPVTARDRKCDVRIIPSGESKSSPTTTSDTVMDDSADVWQPWR